MRRLLALLVFFPALIGWVIFAPCFRLANKLYPWPGSSVWFWCGVEAKDHETYYDVYGEEYP